MPCVLNMKVALTDRSRHVLNGRTGIAQSTNQNRNEIRDSQCTCAHDVKKDKDLFLSAGEKSCNSHKSSNRRSTPSDFPNDRERHLHLPLPRLHLRVVVVPGSASPYLKAILCSRGNRAGRKPPPRQQCKSQLLQSTRSKLGFR
jgi:hypothetical protein